MFPGAGASVYYNEAGEPLGWDYPVDDADSFYCDICGFNHAGGCPDDQRDREEEAYLAAFCDECGTSPCEGRHCDGHSTGPNDEIVYCDGSCC